MRCLSYEDWERERRSEDRQIQILANTELILFNQGKIMSAFDDLQQVVADVVTSNADLSTQMGNVSTEVGKLPGVVDAMEARITAAIKKIVTPAQMQQVTDAIATMRTVVDANAAAAAQAAAAAATAAQASADALDEIDEADVQQPTGPTGPTGSTGPTGPEAPVFATSWAAPSQPGFDNDAAAYKAAGGADAIHLDGIEVQPGTSGNILQRYSHTATGEINDVGPTD